MESKSAKYTFLGTLVAALIAASVALYIHYDGRSNKPEISVNKALEKTKSTANLSVSNVYLPAINTQQDSVFYAEIKNGPYNSANDLKFKLNFGTATITSCETLPINVIDQQTNFETSFVHFSYKRIEKKETIYIYCLLSTPTFESLLISGTNLYSNIEYSLSDYSNTIDDSDSSFMTFFKVIGSIVAVIFIGYFTIILIALFNRKVEQLGV